MTNTPPDLKPVAGVETGRRESPVDGSLILAEAQVTERAKALGNLLALLVSKAHLSKAFCKAARAAQATLTTLNLAHCSKITDVAVVAVASACKQLTSLNLGGCGDITDAAVEAVASGCSQLTSVNLFGCNNISNAAVEDLASECEQLTTLVEHDGYSWAARNFLLSMGRILTHPRFSR